MDWIAPPPGAFLEILPRAKERTYPMLRYYFKAADALKRLRTDKDGLVSFEYVIVGTCVATAVAAAFSTGANGPIKNALTSAINTIGNSVTTAVGS
jgi:hypothetical protein